MTLPTYQIPRRVEGVAHKAVRRWFVRSINKSGQSLLSTAWTDKGEQQRSVTTTSEARTRTTDGHEFEARERPNLMDAVNGNATENMTASQDVSLESSSSMRKLLNNGEIMTDAEIIAELKREPAAELRRLQRMPYEWKVQHSLDIIREFVEHEGENGVYVSFSGCKDSLVLLHLVRSIYPDVPAVFANTGIEYPEQVKFVRTFPNVTEVYPIKHFPKILKEDGIVYPSKEVAMYVKDANKGCKYAINGFKGLDTEGKENRYKSRFKRWAYLLECGVKISPVCCELMK